MRVSPGSTLVALALCALIAAPARAAEPAEAEFKTDIEGLLERLDSSTNGLLTWDGADRIDVRREGDALVADIANARLSIREPDAKTAVPPARLTFDRVGIRRAPAPDDAISLAVVFPRQSTWRNADGDETTLSLKDGTAHAIVDAQSSRARETRLAIAGARLDDKKTGDWIAFGPLSFSSQLTGAADGGWTTPIEFELKGTEFFFPAIPLGGAVERIAYSARTAGSDLAALNRLRDRIDELRQAGDSPPAARLDALLDMLPSLPSLLSLAKGELKIEGMVARAPTGEPLVALAAASMGGALTGLSGETAALRITLKHDGLNLAPALLDHAKVPQRAVIDFGLEEVATAPLRSILDAAKTMREGATDAAKAGATQQMLGAAATLNPVLRIYDVALDTPDVGVDATGEAKGSPLSPKGYSARGDVAVRGFDATGEAKGSPLSPKGYSARGDVAVRGFDALPGLIGDAPFAAYLPVLKEIGTIADASDGTPRTRFHLASAPPNWLTVNGNDVRAWFAGDKASPGKPRPLHPAEPPMSGADVRAVQKALAAAKIPAPETGAYDGATAAAVARFQKQNALNVDGVVDAATRQKLGVKPEPPPAQRGGPQGGQPGRQG